MKKVLSLILWLAIIKFIIFVSELTDAYALVLSIIIVGIAVLLYVSLLIFLRIPKKVKTLAGLYDTYVTINEWKAIYDKSRTKNNKKRLKNRINKQIKLYNDGMIELKPECEHIFSLHNSPKLWIEIEEIY